MLNAFRSLAALANWVMGRWTSPATTPTDEKAEEIQNAAPWWLQEDKEITEPAPATSNKAFSGRDHAIHDVSCRGTEARHEIRNRVEQPETWMEWARSLVDGVVSFVAFVILLWCFRRQLK